MATNLAIDDQLIEAARSLGGQKTKKAVVTHALLEYIQKRQQAKVVELFGTVDYDADYDFKAGRARKKSAQQTQGMRVAKSRAVAARPVV